MDSDTDSDCELPPGWEKSFSNGEPIYINHINNSSQAVSPLKTLLRDNDHSYKSRHNKQSCGFNVGRQKFVQRFDSFSTSEQIIINTNLCAKHAIVIGGCSGIGLEIVHHLISKSCSAILGCPNVTKCTADLVAKIGSECFTDFITIFHLDLSSFTSTKSFCDMVLQETSDASMIILSAGVMCPPFTITSDGFESSLQINLLSQFYIQETLLSTFAASDSECRVIWLACESHRAIQIFDTAHLSPTSAAHYDGFYSYALTNLCKIMLMSQSKRNWDMRRYNRKPLFFACHPGNVVSSTKITRYNPFLGFVFWLLSPFTKTLSQAAATPLLCCVSSSLRNFSGSYFNNGCICQPSALATNENNGKILWNFLSTIMIKLQDPKEI